MLINIAVYIAAVFGLINRCSHIDVLSLRPNCFLKMQKLVNTSSTWWTHVLEEQVCLNATCTWDSHVLWKHMYFRITCTWHTSASIANIHVVTSILSRHIPTQTQVRQHLIINPKPFMGTAWTDDVHQHRVYAANLKNDVGKNDAGSHLDIIVQTDVLEVAFCNECVMCSFW